jgi:TcpE family
MAAFDPDDLIECRTYTHARRFPLMIGQIGGYHLPVPWTLAQLSIAFSTFMLLLLSRRFWAHLGPVGNIAVVISVPLLLSWLVRHLKIEGRTTVRALAGFGRYLARSRTGKLHGRPVRPSRTRRHNAARVFVTQTTDMSPTSGR